MAKCIRCAFNLEPTDDGHSNNLDYFEEVEND